MQVLCMFNILRAMFLIRNDTFNNKCSKCSGAGGGGRWGGGGGGGMGGGGGGGGGVFRFGMQWGAVDTRCLAGQVNYTIDLQL